MSSIYAPRQEVEGLQKAALDILCGDLIGEGSTRRVYALKHNPDLVLKLEYASKQFCNIAERDIWLAVKDTKLEKYFAEVVEIDVWGGALIMRRTTPCTEAEFRKKIKFVPDFMDDTHWANFGWLDGRIVCHDYGFHEAISNAVKAGVMKPVNRKDD